MFICIFFSFLVVVYTSPCLWQILTLEWLKNTNNIKMSTWSQLYSLLESCFTWLVSSLSLLGTASSIVSHARFHPRSTPIEYCFTIPRLFVLTLEETKEGFVVIFVCNLKMDYFVIYVQAPASDNHYEKTVLRPRF